MVLRDASASKNIKSCSFDNILSTSLQNTKGQLNQNGAVFIQNNQRSLFLQIKSSKGKPIRGPLSEKIKTQEKLAQADVL